MPKKIVKFKDFKKIMLKLDRCKVKLQQQFLSAQQQRFEYNQHMQLMYRLIGRRIQLRKMKYSSEAEPNPETSRFTSLRKYTIDVQLGKYAWETYSKKFENMNIKKGVDTALTEVKITDLIKYFANKAKAIKKLVVRYHV